jgi:hypothetical protein
MSFSETSVSQAARDGEPARPTADGLYAQAGIRTARIVSLFVVVWDCSVVA